MGFRDYTFEELFVHGLHAVNVTHQLSAHSNEDEDTGTGNSSTPIVCSGDENGYNGLLAVRIVSIFVIFITSMLGVFTPLVLSHFKQRSTRYGNVMNYVYTFCRYFGAGVILATAFIHLLAPACNKLYDSCLDALGFDSYDWAPCISMIAAWFILVLDLILSRFVEYKFGSQGSHSHSHSQPVGDNYQDHPKDLEDPTLSDKEEEYHVQEFPKSGNSNTTDVTAVTVDRQMLLHQQLGAFYILEFGVIMHSVIIGLTLAVSGDEFKTLFPVIVFHQAFEGMGLGSRLSAMAWKPGFNIQPYILGILYSIVTPIGVAVGIGIRKSWNPIAPGSYAAQGVLDAFSSGILIYAGLVELLAYDFLFDPNREKGTWKTVYMVFCAMLGTGLMALLGKWA
ncbi:ZIP zinc transporter Zrt1 [Schizosaccharomyces japonicus yFS275]|uniref:ZIP zinc transporter Zrt1 n=1 Tax=Schizosaccharomyces japonicus (strain yFS275 / FY16936) TaxID=402676 RepID=B6K657_SCHJY|nr:ZIP zinc transporter Zrt1 [Schizosaccharomyces japonicus yFS275]EEB09011.1 ZIP zinc transporter Zrt1 [Schizosaccharomyces japonicus yFS275]